MDRKSLIYGSKEAHIVNGIDEMNMRSCKMMSLAVGAAEFIMLIVLLVMGDVGELSRMRSVLSAIFCVVVCALTFYSSDNYIKKHLGHKYAMGVLFFAIVCFSIWGVYVSYLNYLRGRQMLVVFMVIMCAVCMIRLRPIVSLITYAAIFSGLFYVLYLGSKAEGIVVLNYIMFFVVCTLLSVINYNISMDLLDKRKRNEELMTSMSDMTFHDALTGLLNRHALDTRIDIIAGKTYFVAMTDINDFHVLNDKYGHHIGDEVLIGVTNCILKFFRRNDCYRYGGDEFLIVCENIGRKEFDKRLLELRMEIKAMKIPGVDLSVSVSSAAAEGKVNKIEDVYKLIKDAESDLVHIKEGAPKMRSDEEELVEGIYDAMKNGEIVPFYQPKVDIRNNHIIGAEALVRWVTDKGVVAPGAFIPVIERTSVICDVDMYMFECVCKNMKEWKKKNLYGLTISCNFSMKHLNNDNFIEDVVAIVDKYDLDYGKLEIEFTETVNPDEMSKLISCVRKFRNIGFKVAMDDFGTGYSSLALLRDIPMDVIKLDRSLISTSGNDSVLINDRLKVFLKNVINLTKDMQMLCLCEGVETEGQKQLLLDLGCNYVQGFLYDRPLPLLEFEKRAAKGSYDMEGADSSEEENLQAGDEGEELALSVLVVEDNEINRYIMINVMKGFGAFVTEASDGKEGLEIFENSEPNEFDVIFMDIQMPNMDGYECTQKIRALDREDAKEIPIIAITADSYKETQEKTRSSGMTDYILKPVDPMIIKQKLEALL